MLWHIWRNASNRKLRLFVCAVCRADWSALADERSRKAVETGERFADGLADDDELAAANEAARVVVEAAVAQQDFHKAAWAAEARRTTELAKDCIARRMGTGQSNVECTLLRDIFRNPFRPCPPLDPAWRTSDVVSLASNAYETRAFDRLPEVASALAEAGCTDADLVAHLWEKGPHVRGCWALDMVLAKR